MNLTLISVFFVSHRLRVLVKFSDEISLTHKTRHFDGKSLTHETRHSDGVSQNMAINFGPCSDETRKLFGGSELNGELT